MGKIFSFFQFLRPDSLLLGILICNPREHVSIFSCFSSSSDWTFSFLFMPTFANYFLFVFFLLFLSSINVNMCGLFFFFIFTNFFGTYLSPFFSSFSCYSILSFINFFLPFRLFHFAAFYLNLPRKFHSLFCFSPLIIFDKFSLPSGY